MTNDWIIAKEFKDDASGIVVRVSELDRGKFRNWNISIGAHNVEDPENRPLRFYLPVRFNQESIRLVSPAPELERNYETVIGELVFAATSWVRDRASEDHQIRVAEAYDRDKRAADRGKPVTRVTGKTAREKDKGRERTG